MPLGHRATLSPQNSLHLYPMKKHLLICILLLSGILQLCYGQTVSDSDSLKQALLLANGAEERVSLFLQLSETYLNTDPETAGEYAADALLIAENESLESAQLYALLLIAEVNQIKTNLKESIDYAIQAKEMATERNELLQVAKSNMILANCFRQLGDYAKSSDLCFDALETYESLNDSSGMCDALSAIGIFYYEQDDYKKAYEYFQQSIDIAEKTNNIRGISRGLNNASVALSEYGFKEESIRKLYEAIALNNKTGEKLWEGINRSNLGEEYLEQGLLDSVFYYANTAIALFDELNNQNDRFNSYILLSRYYEEKRIPDSAMYYAYSSWRVSLENHLLVDQQSAARRLKNLYLEAGITDSAYHYLEIQSATKDSLDREKGLTKLSQLEQLYAFEKEQQERELEAQRREFILILVAVSLILTIIVIVLLLIRYRMKMRYTSLQKEQLESELDHKNKELASNVMSLMKKNEMLSEITGRLRKVEKSAAREDTRTAIRKIALEIENTNQEKIWEEFELRFKQVYSGFYDKLLGQFPDLSPNEQRLCAFLKLNLTTKEISQITGQSNRAIEMARFRLRKKLGIDSQEVNLVSFIGRI